MASEGQPRRIRRRWLVAAAVALVAAVVSWQLLERALDVDRYRAEVEEALSRATGLPARVGRLDLAWRPIPCLSAVDVSLGDAALRIETARIDAFPAVHALLWRRVEVPRIALDELVVTLPPDRDALERAVREVRAHLEQAFADDPSDEESSSGWSVSVGQVRTEGAAVRFGEAKPVATLDVIADGIDTDELALAVDASVPNVDGRVEGEVFLPLTGEPVLPGLRGGFDLSAERPGPLLGLPSFLDYHWEARAEVSGTDAGAVRTTLVGGFAPHEAAAPRGSFEGEAWALGETPATARLAIAGDGFSLRASADAGRAVLLHIESLDVHGPSLARVLQSASSDALQLVPADGARVEGRGFEVDVGPEGWPQILAGEVSVRGIQVVRDERRIADGASADARWQDGVISISDLRVGPFALRGSLTPAPAWRHVDLALSGELSLSDDWLHAAGVPESLRDVRGTLRIDEIAGRLPVTEESDPLRVHARLAGAALRFVTEGVDDAISNVSLDLTSREGRIFVEGGARSRQLGDVALRATLEPAMKRAHGNVSLDATHLAAYVSDPALRERVAPLLESIGAGRIGFQLAAVAGSEEAWRLELERDASPRLTAAVDLAPGGEELLGDVRADLEVPAAGLRGLLSDEARATGAARVRVERDAAAARFGIDADLTPLGFASGEFVEKQAGEALAVRLDGGASDEDDAGPWTPRHLELRSATDAIAFAWRDGGPVAPDLDVDLSAWSFLLARDASASGRVRGSLDAPASKLSLALEEVGLHLSDEIGLDAVDGRVERDGDDWSVSALRMRGAGSDATLDARLSERTLRGELEGSLDLDFVQVLVREVQALLPDAGPEEEVAPISGELAIRLDRVGYGRSEGRNAVATIALADGGVAVRDLSVDTYEGNVSGTVDVEAGDPARLRLALSIAGVTGRFLDDAFFEPPREIRGRFDATLRLVAPLLGDAKATFAEADGQLDVVGKDGSFGKLGLATKLIAVLRSTEALRAKLPSIRDEGLVFDATRLEVAMERGVAHVKVLDVDSKAYAIDGSGTLDFRDEQSDLRMEVNIIKGLSGVVSWIPVAGSALEILNVRMVARGSPWDLQVGVAGFRDQLLGAGRAGMGAVIGDASEALRVLRRGAGRGEERAPESAPETGAERDLPPATASEEATPAANEKDPAAAPPPEEEETPDDPEPAPGEPL